MVPNAVANPSGRITGGANLSPGAAYGVYKIRSDSREDSRPLATARTSGLSVSSATRWKYSNARPIEWAQRSGNGATAWEPLPESICGVRLRRIRPADSNATCPAHVPEQHIWADINNSDFTSDGASSPYPAADTSSRPDVFAGRRCPISRNGDKSTSHGHATNISLRADNGSRLSWCSSMTTSRRFAGSNAPRISRRDGTAAPGDHAPVEEAKPLSAQASHGAIDGERRPTQSGHGNQFPSVVLCFV